MSGGATTNGAALQSARQEKQAKYRELLEGHRSGLIEAKVTATVPMRFGKPCFEVRRPNGSGSVLGVGRRTSHARRAVARSGEQGAGRTQRTRESGGVPR